MQTHARKDNRLTLAKLPGRLPQDGPDRLAIHPRNWSWHQLFLPY